MSILCRIGLHSIVVPQRFVYDEKGLMVLEFISTVKCSKCGHIKDHTHWVWNGFTMVDKEEK